MLLWYTKFIGEQSAEPRFSGCVEGSAQYDSRGCRRVSVVQFNLNFHIRSDGFGFFQDICFTFLTYDSCHRSDMNFFPLGGGLLGLG